MAMPMTLLPRCLHRARLVKTSFSFPATRSFRTSSAMRQQQQTKEKEALPTQVDESRSSRGELTLGEKAKENAKTAGYGGVILVGLGITGVLLYQLFAELFSKSSPVVLFQKASEQCVEHPKVQDLLGEPIKAFGETTRRGRRRHVSYVEYVDEKGKKGIRVQFYLQGLRKRGTGQLDVREDANGVMKTRYLIVTADDLLHTTVVVEDNR